jgi:hypothetical protein
MPVRLKRTVSAAGRWASFTLAGLLSLFLLAVSILSVSPTLHQCLHHDSDAKDHFCLVSVFASGQVSTADAAGAVVLPVLPGVSTLLLLQSEPVASPDRRLAPSRAPPQS